MLRQAAPAPTAAGPNGGGGVLAADPEQLSKGAQHLAHISDLVADIFRQALSVHIYAEGDGPIAKAIREIYGPAKIDSDGLLDGLGKLVDFNSGQTLDLSRLMHTVNVSATEDAAHLIRPEG